MKSWIKLVCFLMLFSLWSGGYKNSTSGGAHAYVKFPSFFIPNVGQEDERVKFYLKNSDHTFFFTQEGVVYSFTNKERSSVINQRFINANKNLRTRGIEKTPGKINYFIGNKTEKWKTNIPSYSKIAYENIYHGIDLIFSADGPMLKSEFRIAPRADYREILLAFNEVESLSLTDGDSLVVKIREGELIEGKPYIYQEIDGRKVEVEGRYEIKGNQYGFKLGSYNPDYPLIIDPSLSYSSYLGGSGNDTGYGIAADPAGNIYVVGETDSTNFPTTVGAVQPTIRAGGFRDVFVSKIDPGGSSLVYGTYLGGDSNDFGYGIAVDSSGNAYVTGRTDSLNFPTVTPFQALLGGGVAGTPDAFVTKLNQSGSRLIYSTYLGAGGRDFGMGIAVDSVGNAYITGQTGSSVFPIASPFQRRPGGAGDAFVTKLNTDGRTLIYSTYLGGTGEDMGNSIAIDSEGRAHVVGYTSSANFPLNFSPSQEDQPGTDAFVIKFNPEGNALLYSTYLGGGGDDMGSDVAVDSAGNIYVTGQTNSVNFLAGFSVRNANAGGVDAFVVKIIPTEDDAVSYATYLGGSATDYGKSIVVDSAGNAYIGGSTNSINFPTTAGAFQLRRAGGTDAFISKLLPDGRALIYSTYFGGSNSADWVTAVALDADNNIYVTGLTSSSNFPTMAPLQPMIGGGSDAFVAKFDITPPVVLSTNPAGGAVDIDININITAAFSESLNGDFLLPSSFSVNSPDGVVDGRVIWDDGSHTATFIPNAPLANSTLYTVTLSTELRDLLDNHMAESYVFSFTTARLPDLVPPAPPVPPEPPPVEVVGEEPPVASQPTIADEPQSPPPVVSSPTTDEPQSGPSAPAVPGSGGGCSCTVCQKH